MIEIRYIQQQDRDFWFRLDKHLSEAEFERKVRDKLGFVLVKGSVPIGLLRYNLFWDNTPFCNMLFIDWPYQRQGYGKELMTYWETEMHSLGYHTLLLSTQADESAQHFYRKLGYTDCGGFVLDQQPMELFFTKSI